MAETTTDYGRQNLPWPDLGFDAGVNLHAAIVGSVAVLSDQISAKWSGSQAIPAGNTIQLAHNFGLSLGELRIRIVESGAELTQGNDTDFGISEVDVNTINIQNNDAVARTIEIYVYPRAKMRGEDLDPAIVINTTGNATVGNMTVTGDLEVQGTTTTLNTETLDVEDANITINKGGTDASAEGAGLTIKGTGGSDLGGVEYDSSLNSKFKVGDATKREILTADGQQSVTNKDIDGGTASNTSRISVPRGADLATLQALTRKQGAIVYNQDKNEFLGDTGTELKTIGGGGGLVPLAIDHTFAGTIERDTEYMVDLSAGSLAVNLPVGLGDEQYKIAFNIRVIEQGTYNLTVSSQSSQDIFWNEVADTSFLIDEDVRVEFAWDGTQWTAKSAWYPTYTNLPVATATQSGIVSTGTQTFAGDKTFTGNVDAASYTGLPEASTTQDGVVTTGTQTFAGLKTFKRGDNVSSAIYVDADDGFDSGIEFRQDGLRKWYAFSDDSQSDNFRLFSGAGNTAITANQAGEVDFPQPTTTTRVTGTSFEAASTVTVLNDTTPTTVLSGVSNNLKGTYIVTVSRSATGGSYAAQSIAIIAITTIGSALLATLRSDPDVVISLSGGTIQAQTIPSYDGNSFKATAVPLMRYE